MKILVLIYRPEWDWKTKIPSNIHTLVVSKKWNTYYRYLYGYKNNNNEKNNEKGLYQSNVDYNTPQVQCVTGKQP